MMSFAEFRRRAGAYDLVGVAPLECFAGLPPNEHPLSLFPDGKSVVVLGQRIRRGEFRSMEEGSLWQTPYRWLHDLDGVVRYIESEGYECVPYAPVDAPRMPKRPVREGQCAPNDFRLSIEYAATAAGLGEIGYHGLFMSPRFGIRQMLGLLVTDMEIEPSRPTPAPVCDGCLECARQCPLGAISLTESMALRAGARSMNVGLINGLACQACPNGVCGDSKYFAGAEELHFEIENNQVKSDARSRFVPGGLPNRLSAACGRACIAHFEATHDTGYKLGFRLRQPWGFRPDTEKGW
jgi:epoxyqueuosine reductase